MTDEQRVPFPARPDGDPSFDLNLGLLGGEKAVVIGLAHKPDYKVPGREKDGTPSELGLAEALEYQRSRPILVGHGLLDLIFPSSHFYVRGPANAKAIPMADALVDFNASFNGTPKFVYSDHFVAVIRAWGRKGRYTKETLLWWSGPDERVNVAREGWRRFTITWDDGSSIVFDTFALDRRGLRKAYE